MALKLSFSALSFGASVDQQTGTLSVFEVVEELRTPQVPINLQSLVISLSLAKTEEVEASGKVFIHVLNPDGQQAKIGQGDLKVPAAQKRVRAVFRLGGFPITQFGAHRFVVSWTNETGRKEGEAIFDFDVIQATQVAQGVPPRADDPAGAPPVH